MSFNYIVENCGNFSAKVLPGMIAYGRETTKEDRSQTPNPDLPKGDGYATKEHDIQLGGFLYRQCAKEAMEQGKHLSELSVEETQSIALKISRRHIEQHGEVGLENYRHWMKRVSSYAKHRGIELPSKEPNETNYHYSQRLRRWTERRPEKWPKMQKAVGTHLVFSPDPKIWAELRAKGLDEREFLKEVLSGTMKELQDWRRKELGPGHSLGWVAGTHVSQNGADRHPHIHVVVLKRDESGKETDWSVSALKGRTGRGQEPDPLMKAKKLFQKNTEKAYEKYVGRAPGVEKEPEVEKVKARAQLPSVKKLRKLTATLFPNPYSRPKSDLGALIRILRMYRKERGITDKDYVKDNLPTLNEFKKWLEKSFPKHKAQSRGLEPGE